MCFFNSAEKAYLEQRETISILNYLSFRKHCMQKLTQYSQGINVLDAPASNTYCFLWEIHVFHSLGWIGLLGTRWVFLHFENYVFQKYSFLKLTQFSQGKKILDPAASNIDGFLWRGTWLSSTQLNSPNGENKAYLALETTTNQEVFLSKTNMDGFLLRDICVSSTYLNRRIWNKVSIVYFENWDLQGVFVSRTNWILAGTHCARCGSI
jgi:hypothetical protein